MVDEEQRAYQLARVNLLLAGEELAFLKKFADELERQLTGDGPAEPALTLVTWRADDEESQ